MTSKLRMNYWVRDPNGKSTKPANEMGIDIFEYEARQALAVLDCRCGKTDSSGDHFEIESPKSMKDLFDMATEYDLPFDTRQVVKIA